MVRCRGGHRCGSRCLRHAGSKVSVWEGSLLSRKVGQKVIENHVESWPEHSRTEVTSTEVKDCSCFAIGAVNAAILEPWGLLGQYTLARSKKRRDIDAGGWAAAAGPRLVPLLR
jgi:hypothetical protein